MPAFTEIRDSQRALWNRFSAGWKKWDSFLMLWMAPVGEAMLAQVQLSPSSQVLDVATGTGEPGLTAAKLVPQGSVLAVDLSEEMLAVAQEKSAKANLKNFSTQHYDGLHLPDGPFDAALCRFGVMFFPDAEAGVKEMKRVLKKGGRAAWAVWHGPEKNPWAALPQRAVGEILNLQPPAPGTPDIFRCAAPGLTEDLFKKAGFTNVKEVDVPAVLHFRDGEHYWEYLNDVVAPVVNALSKATPEQRELAHQKIIEATAPFITDNGLSFPWLAKVTVGEAG